MITKNLTIPQTMPTTVYDENSDFINSSENFSVLPARNNISYLQSSSIKPNLRLNRMDFNVKSVNYFQNNNSSGRNKKIVNKSLTTSSENFKSTSLHAYNHNNSTEISDMYGINNNYNQESFIIPKNKQQPFQKYSNEKQINHHFKPRTIDLNSTKFMISKMLNGNIEENASTNSLAFSSTSLDLASHSGPIKPSTFEYFRMVNYFVFA